MRLRHVATLLAFFAASVPLFGAFAVAGAEESHPGLEAEADYAEAIILYNRKQYRDSLGVLDRLLEASPRYVPALELKALTYKLEGKDEDSLGSYKKLLPLTPEKNRGPY